MDQQFVAACTTVKTATDLIGRSQKFVLGRYKTLMLIVE